MTRNRPRINPFAAGTPEHTLFARHRRAILDLAKVEEEMAQLRSRHALARAQADAWANALRNLGHGDKLPGQPLLPDHSKGEAGQ